MASISSHAFITDALREIDRVIGHFVEIAYQSFIRENTIIITMIFTLYVIFIGYRILMRNYPADIISLTNHMIILLIVYGLVMQWDLYHRFIYHIFTNEPEHIARVLVNSTGQRVTTQEVGEALNEIYHGGMQSAKFLLATRGIKTSLFGMIVACFTFLACLQALVFLIYAKMGMAVLLALGPLFILFTLWNNTKGWFIRWLNSLFVLALIPILTVTILSLMLSIIHLVTDDLIEQAKVGEIGFFTIILFGGLSIVNFSLLRQVLPLAGSLGSGFNLQAFKLNISTNRLNLPKQVSSVFKNTSDRKNEKTHYASSSQSNNTQRASPVAKHSKV
jgi:type IV secretion system protein VirB6